MSESLIDWDLPKACKPHHPNHYTALGLPVHVFSLNECSKHKRDMGCCMIWTNCFAWRKETRGRGSYIEYTDFEIKAYLLRLCITLCKEPLKEQPLSIPVLQLLWGLYQLVFGSIPSGALGIEIISTWNVCLNIRSKVNTAVNVNANSFTYLWINSLIR